MYNDENEFTQEEYIHKEYINEETIPSEENGDSECQPMISGDSLPINLSFEAGQLTMPFSELNMIKPGYVFELKQKLDHKTITIYANSKAIARGQLVCVGELVGVRVTEIMQRKTVVDY